MGCSTAQVKVGVTAPPQKTRVLLVDDHELVRRGLHAVLESEPGYEVCGEADNGLGALEKVRQLKPDVVVLDICLPGLNGVEIARRIAKNFPECRILALTMSDSEQLAYQLLDSGVQGYLLKSDAARDLMVGVESVRCGRPFFTSKVSTMVLHGYLDATARTREPKETPALPLTPQERQITQLLAEGESNKEVATTLNITVKTAETHRANIMRKLGLHSISDLVRYAVRNQIIEA
ncbi:MAG TPA: response regulator transcription factor, partial [Terriglobia bacterium]|nr:response regulator transcription factor [Terriglobia bacterium]